MEHKTYESYIDLLISELTYDDFSPSNSESIPILMRKKFYAESPYWTKHSDENNAFYIQFKKYGENRECVILKLGFSSRWLELTLVDRELKIIERQAELLYSDIWKNHGVLSDAFKKIMRTGLELSERVENIE